MPFIQFWHSSGGKMEQGSLEGNHTWCLPNTSHTRFTHPLPRIPPTASPLASVQSTVYNTYDPSLALNRQARSTGTLWVQAFLLHFPFIYLVADMLILSHDMSSFLPSLPTPFSPTTVSTRLTQVQSHTSQHHYTNTRPVYQEIESSNRHNIWELLVKIQSYLLLQRISATSNTQSEAKRTSWLNHHL